MNTGVSLYLKQSWINSTTVCPILNILSLAIHFEFESREEQQQKYVDLRLLEYSLCATTHSSVFSAWLPQNFPYNSKRFS